MAEETEYVWDKEIAVPASLIQYIDEGVRESTYLPDLRRARRLERVEVMSVPTSRLLTLPMFRIVLPAGTTFHGISPSGASYWARTAKIDATNEAGEETPFFIKVLLSADPETAWITTD